MLNFVDWRLTLCTTSVLSIFLGATALAQPMNTNDTHRHAIKKSLRGTIQKSGVNSATDLNGKKLKSKASADFGGLNEQKPVSDKNKNEQLPAFDDNRNELSEQSPRRGKQESNGNNNQRGQNEDSGANEPDGNNNQVGKHN